MCIQRIVFKLRFCNTDALPCTAKVVCVEVISGFSDPGVVICVVDVDDTAEPDK